MNNRYRSLIRKAQDFAISLRTMREDINSNTSQNAKLLYRLEESELQYKILDERVKDLEKGG